MGKVLFNYTFDNKNMYFLDKQINYEDVVKYYIEENHSKIETASYFNVSITGLSKLIKHFNIKKPSVLSHEHNKKTCLKKYGNPTYNNTKQNIETCQKRYGVDNVFQSKEVIQKIKEKHTNDYGTLDNYYSHTHIKGNNTMIEKYGMHYSQTEECKKKKEQTCMSHFGTKYPMQSNEVKKKYDFKANSEKAFQTRIKHGTTNTSKPQKELFLALCDIFGKDAIIPEYKEKRYPYHCDFYVKSIDLFIELNLFFTHGSCGKTPPHLYNPENEDDIEILQKWKEKAKHSTFYKNAIDVWTIRDVSKHNTAIINNLNFKEIYSLEEMNNFIEELKLLYKENLINEI